MSGAENPGGRDAFLETLFAALDVAREDPDSLRGLVVLLVRTGDRVSEHVSPELSWQDRLYAMTAAYQAAIGAALTTPGVKDEEIYGVVRRALAQKGGAPAVSGMAAGMAAARAYAEGRVGDDGRAPVLRCEKVKPRFGGPARCWLEHGHGGSCEFSLLGRPEGQ